MARSRSCAWCPSTRSRSSTAAARPTSPSWCARSRARSESGAPLYNAGNTEACFRIYEGTATKWEHDSPCKGVSRAFGDGLLRAQALKSYKEKAWAMRDTFDGLTVVAEKWARAPRPPGKK